MGADDDINHSSESVQDLTNSASVEERIAKELGSFGREAETIPEEQAPVSSWSGIALHPGVELGIDDMSALMSEEPSQLIAILGPQNAGKTLYLVALYLICACGQSQDFGYEFAGSLTLPGFEDRARNSRRWQFDQMPTKMTAHTRVTDSRGPGFMHLDLFNTNTSSFRRLFLSDLPGEWTTQLIDDVQVSERFTFLNRADVVCLMVEAASLVGPSRHSEVEKQRMLIDRIKAITPPKGRKLAILASKGDVLKLEQPPALQEIADYAEQAGFEARAMTIASVSSQQEIDSGAGIFESLAWMLAPARRSNVDGMSSHSVPPRYFGWLPVSNGGADLG